MAFGKPLEVSFVPALDPEFPKNDLASRQGDGGYPIGRGDVKPDAPSGCPLPRLALCGCGGPHLLEAKGQPYFWLPLDPP